MNRIIILVSCIWIISFSVGFLIYTIITMIKEIKQENKDFDDFTF